MPANYFALAAIGLLLVFLNALNAAFCINNALTGQPIPEYESGLVFTAQAYNNLQVIWFILAILTLLGDRNAR